MFWRSPPDNYGMGQAFATRFFKEKNLKKSSNNLLKYGVFTNSRIQKFKIEYTSDP